MTIKRYPAASVSASTVASLVTNVTSGAPTLPASEGAIAIDTTNDAIYIRSGNAWKEIDLSATLQSSDTPPSNPASGDIWFETDTGKTLTYYADGSSNQWIEIGAATSAGVVGSDGKIQFAESSAFASDTLLHWDNTNNRLGVGTASPAETFHVYSNADNEWTAIFDQDHATGYGVKITGDMTATNDALLKIEAGSTQVFRQTQAGLLLGAGTVAETPLHIVAANTLGSTFTGTVDGEGLRVAQSDYSADNYVSLVEAPYDDGQTAAHVRIGAMFDGGGSHLAFGTSNNFANGITNTAMFIDEVGNVGIGTTAPAAHLSVLDAAQTTGSDLMLARYWNATNEVRGSGIFHYYDATVKDILAFGVAGDKYGGGTDYNSPIAFANTKMVINAAGNVGIGTTSPQCPLVVRDQSNDTVSLLLRANNDGATVGKTYLAINPYDSSSDTYMGTMIGAEEYDAADRRAHMTFFTRGSNSHVAPTERMRITSAGRVGIGTATPAYKLDVNGDINLAAGSTLYYDHGNLSANDSIVLHIDAGSDNDVSIFRVSTDSWNTTGDYGVTMKYMGDENGIYNGLSIFMDNQTGTQIEAMSFLQNGKVGINRIDPIYRLDVLGDGSTAYAARFTAGAGTAHGVKIQLGSPSPGTKWLLFDDSTGTEHGCIQGSGNGVSFHNNSDRRLKKDIVDLDNGVAVINALQPRFFVWDGCDDLGQQAGFIADEVQPVLPAIVKGETDAMKVTPAIEGREEEVDADGNVIRQGVEAEPERTVIDPQQLDIGKMMPYVVDALQTLITRVEALEAG